VEHPRPERDLGISGADDFDGHVRPVGPLLVLGRDKLELGHGFRRTERDDHPSALELGEKEHVVDELAHQLDFGTNLLQDRGGV